MRTLTNPPRRQLSEADFCTWVGRSSPGDTLEYHRGFLAVQIGIGRAAGAEQDALRMLARRAAWAAERRLVHLVQRRNGPDDFSYLAIRRPTPRPQLRGSRMPAPSVTAPELEVAT
jgi:hypothetical protein